MIKNEEKVEEKFIEQMGIIAQADGLPRIAGRLMGFMVLKVGPFSFSDLAEHLNVSRGSISTNTRLLENMGVIERVAKPGDRQDYFQLSNEPYSKLLQGLTYRMDKAETIVRETQKTLADKKARQRLRELADFYHGLIGAYQKLIGRMKGSL